MAVNTDSLATTEQKRGKGRPRIVLKDLPIDPYELTEYLASIHCTQEEIAVALGISLDTLRRRTGLRTTATEVDDRNVYVDEELARAYKKGCNNAKVRLRRLLDEHAKKHYAAAIFVAKNELGYTDRQAVQHEGDSTSVTVVNAPEHPMTATRDTVPVEVERCQD